METEVLFNLGAKTNSSKSLAKEGVHYKLWSPKKGGIPIKIFNFENQEICPRKGIIELSVFGGAKNVNGHRRHKTSVKFDKVYDTTNNIVIGYPIGYNEKEDRPIYKTIFLEENNIFNLANEEDAIKWAIVKNSYYVEGSPNIFDKKMVMFRVNDIEREAELFLAKREIKRKSEVIAQGLFGQQLVETGLTLGLDVDNMSHTVLQMHVCKIAEADPKRFMEIWDSPSKLEIATLKRAISTGIIVQDIQFGFMYNALSLGINEPLVVDYLRQNPQIRGVIDQQAKDKQSESVKAMSLESPSTIQDEKDARIAKLEADLAAAKEGMKKVSEVKLDELAEGIAFNMSQTEDKDYNSLLAEAKRLKIPGAHLIKDKEKLEQKIKDATAKIEVV